MRNRWWGLIVALFVSTASLAQVSQAPPSPGPDERFKADILLIVAHPDDETAISGYLAQAIFDEHKRVAVVYGTRGDGGGNQVGYEQAASLGVVREIEARRALASFGITNAWFLGGPDTPGQDVLRSLETWHHGAVLEQVVRLVRLTRPEVILTWLPDYVVGENHGDHQASSVLAVEAFDMAGDPTRFPEQITPPRNRRGIANLTEGLRPWQPQKIYFFSDANHFEFFEGRGPQYPVTAVSPSRQAPYYRLDAEEASFHLTQEGLIAKRALETGDFHEFQEPTRFVFGKSLVKSSITGDIFEGVASAPAGFTAVRGYQPQAHAGISLELGGPFVFYSKFWQAHNIAHLAHLLAPEAGIGGGETLSIPLLVHNDSDEPAEVVLTTTLPGGWNEREGSARYPVAPHDTYPIEAVILAPSSGTPGWHEIIWTAAASGHTVGSVALRVYLSKVSPAGTLPQ